MPKSTCIKQAPGSDDCVACVAAMATGTSVKRFREVMGDGGPYSDWQFSAYCMLYGFIVGIGARWDRSPFDPDKEKMGIGLDLADIPAYVIVDSETRSGIEHSVYWDTKQVLDPNPLVLNPRKLSSYKIMNVFPICKLDQDGNLIYSVMRKIITERLRK